MATLTGLFISQSYGGVVHLTTNTGIVGGVFTQLQDGFGTNLGLQVNGSSVSASFTGSLFGTASYANNANSASYALNASSATSASFATTAASATSASFATSAASATSASFATTTISASYTLSASYALSASSAISASFATSASWAPFIPTPTGSFATTGSNTFVGNQVISGSVSNAVRALTISSNTASIDLSTGNLFTLSLVNGANTHISASNIQRGQTTSIQITQGTLGTGTVTFNSVFTFPSGSSYVPFAISSAIDLISFISFDATKLRAVSQNNFI